MSTTSRLRGSAFFLLLLMIGAGGGGAADDPLARLLGTGGESVSRVLGDPGFGVQIVYTTIDRQKGDDPKFSTFSHGVSERPDYFYPASTIKLPTALAALEKLGELKASGVRRDSRMMTDVAHDWQTAVVEDASAESGFPSVGNYLRKVFLVSDNDAHNRLFEFVGVDMLNEGLKAKGYSGVRIFHRLAVRREPWHGGHGNPIRFLGDDGELLHAQAASRGGIDYTSQKPILRGAAYIDRDGARREEPKDFSGLSELPLGAQQKMLMALVFPDAFPKNERWKITEENRRFVLRAMSEEPGDSNWPKYERAAYHDRYAKFLLYGSEPEAAVPASVTSIGKSGMAYGFLIDNVYVVDFEKGVEFFLSAMIYTNANETFNDDVYEYDTVGLPFMRDLGRLLYDYELGRERALRPARELLEKELGMARSADLR